MIQNLIFGVHVLNSVFLVLSLRANKNTQKTSFILRTSTHSTLTKIYSSNTAKNLTHFTGFPTNTILVAARKSICIAPFLDAQEKHS